MSRPPAILVCFAVEEEAKPFRKLVRDHSNVRILVTGIGQANARQATEAAFKDDAPGSVLTCGFAGGLNPNWPRGTVLYSATKDFPHSDRLGEAGADAGTFHCEERVLITTAEKQNAREATGADAVEMESGTIWKICETIDVPCATVRVISDAADETLPLDFNRLLNSENKISHAALAKALLKCPGSIPGLIRFQRNITECADRLGTVLARALLPEN